MVEVREAGGPLDRLISRGPPPSLTPKSNGRLFVPPSSSNFPSSDGPDVPMSSPGDGESTPTSSAESVNGRKKKRVEFSPYNQYHPADQKYPPQLKRSNSAMNAPPSKSILKPYQNIAGALNSEDTGDLSDFGQPAFNPATFGEMLESVVKALASPERSKKSDTYSAFANSLRAYDAIPDQKALADKTGLICSFIKRDLSMRMEDNNAQDLMVIKQALKVLSMLTWLPFLQDSIDDEDGIFFTQWAITTIEQSTSKAVINACLHLLALQKFNNKVINNERAGRIITVVDLRNKPLSASSVSAIIERIGIYHNLLHQARQVMLLRVTDWMDHLFEGMLSKIRDVRTRAIALATEVAKTIGMEKNVSRAVYQLLGSSNLKLGTNGNATNLKSQSMFQTVKETLENMVASSNKDDAIQVPQIWGNVVALMRGLTVPFDRWEHFSPWLTIISKCFNSSEISLKVQAHVAWGKVVYVTNLSPETQDKRWDLVGKPIVGYLDRTKIIKNSRIARDAAMKNINTLLYYGFRPNCSPKQSHLAWKWFVVNLLEKHVLCSKSSAPAGCVVLGWLFDPTPPSAKWNEARVLDPTPIKSDELPRLDPKWVRGNSEPLLNTMEVAFESAYWMEEGGQAPDMWRKFNACIAAAGSKEVKASAELMETVANIIKLLQRMWTQVPPMLTGSATALSSFVVKFTTLITITLEVLKPLCFTESKLSHDGQNFAAVMGTPSGRSSSHGSTSLVMQSPALHLFALLMKPPKELVVDDVYMNCVENFLWTCVESRDSRRKRLGLLTEAMSMLPTNNVENIHLAAWEILSGLATRSMPLLAKEKALSSPSPAGHDFREAVRILEWGCQNGEASVFTQWEALFIKLRETVHREFGEAEVCSAIVQPLADILRQQKVSERVLLLQYASLLLQNAIFPKLKANPDTIQRNLYGIPSRKMLTVMDPFESLYRMLNEFLPDCFNIIQDSQTDSDIALGFLGSLITFIGKIPVTSLVKALRQFQDGLSYWMEMESTGELSKQKSSELWKAVLDALARVSDHDSAMLQQIGPLLTSGLASQRGSIVSSTLTYWNNSFGLEESLEYPSPVRRCLVRLRSVADINLPTFPEVDNEEITETPPRFSETQTEDDLWSEQSRSSVFKIRTPRLQVSAPNLLAKNTRDKTPTKPSSRPSTSLNRKLRHMDSQINFEAIVSEDADEEVESQMLTERQKEVKERQSNDMLFKNVGALTPVKSSKASARSPSQSLSPNAKLVLRIASPEIPSSTTLQKSRMLERANDNQSSPEKQGSGKSFLKTPRFGQEIEMLSSPLARASARKSRTPVKIREEIPSSPPETPKEEDTEFVDDPDDPFVDNDSSSRRGQSQTPKGKTVSDALLKLVVEGEVEDVDKTPTNRHAHNDVDNEEIPGIAELPEEEETDVDEDINDHMDVIEETVLDVVISPTDDGEVSRQLMSEISLSQSFAEEVVSPVSPVDEKAPRGKPGRGRRGSNTRKRKRDVRVVEPFSDATPNLSDDDALDCIVVSTADKKGQKNQKEQTQYETAPTVPGGLEVGEEAMPPKKKLKSPSPPDIPSKPAQSIPTLRKTRSWLGTLTATTTAASDAGMVQSSDLLVAGMADESLKAKTPRNKNLTRLNGKQRLSLPSTFRTRKAGTASSIEDSSNASSDTVVDADVTAKASENLVRNVNFSVTIPIKKMTSQEEPAAAKVTTEEPEPTDNEEDTEVDEVSNADMIAKLTKSLDEFKTVLDRADDQLEVLNEAENMLWRMMSKVRIQKAAISRRPAS